MSDVYEPWERLIRIVVLGKALDVPEKNLLLRQLQYVSEDVGMGRYCWNAETWTSRCPTSVPATTPSTPGSPAGCGASTACGSPSSLPRSATT